MNDISGRVRELLCVLEVPEGSEITAEEKKSGYLDIAVDGKYFDTYDMANDRLVQGNLRFARQMMQRDCYVTATIADPGLYCSNEQYEAVEVWCPATENEWEDASQRARVSLQKAELVGCAIMDKIFYEADYLTGHSSLEELNFLGSRLCSMDDEERILFQGKMEQHDKKSLTAKDCINMSYNMKQCQIAYNVTNLKELGEFFAEQNMVPELKNLPSEALELIDYTKIGEKIHAEKAGVFIDEGYFYDETQDFQRFYDGKTLPEQPEDDTYLFRVKVSKRPGSSEEVAGGVWVSLPQEAEKLQNVPNALGVDNWDDCCLLGVQSILRDMQLCINHPKDIESLNVLAQEIDALDRPEQIKFKAVLEASEYQTIDDVQALFDQLENYQLYNTMVSMDDYVKQRLETKMKTKLPEELVQFIDFDGYYEAVMKDEHVFGTEYGILKRKDVSPETEMAREMIMDEPSSC